MEYPTPPGPSLSLSGGLVPNISGFTLNIGFSLSHVIPLVSSDDLKLHLYHKWENHRTALGLLIIKFMQYISNFGVDEAPLGRAVTTVV